MARKSAAKKPMEKPIEEAKPQASGQANPVLDLYYGTAEKTYHDSAWVPDSYLKPYNSDDLFRKTGDYRIYQEMRNDDQVSVCMQLKKDLVIGAGWNIVSEKAESKATDKKDKLKEKYELEDEMSEEANEEIASDIYQRLEEDPDVSFDEQLEELIENAYSYGFALSEKLFKLRDDNTLTWNEMKTRHPASWLIHTDKHGNVIRLEQGTSKGSIDANPKSMIHYINSRLWQNPYGKSDMRAAYEAWMVKRHLVRYFSIFAEKYASPIPVAKYDKGAPRDKVTEVHNIVKKFMQKTAMTIPKDFEIEFLEAKSNGEAYLKGINLMNMFIGRALVIPDLLGFSGEGSQQGGSQALGREQMNVFMQHIKRRRRTLERIVNKHVVQPLVVWNHGNVECYPKFQLLPASEEDANKYATTFLEAVKGKVYKPSDEEINHFRSLIKFPEGEVEREEPMLALGVPPKDGEDPKLGNKEPKEGNKPKKSPFSLKPIEGVDYSAKVDFKLISGGLDAAEQGIMSDAQGIIAEVFADLYDQIFKKKMLENPGRIDKLEVKHKNRLQKILKSHLFDFYKVSRINARQELFKGRFAQPLPSDKFLEFLDGETYDYIADWEYKISQGARLAIKGAIKDGRPISSVISMIDEETRQEATVSLERYSRTKFTEVMNRARVEEFAESKVVKGFQYSAILDDRTSDICAGLHGKTFAMGTEPIPPMHFNCRSLLIPITIFEDFTPSSKVGGVEINKFIEENKGKGFSTR